MFGAEGDDTSAVAVVELTLKTKEVSLPPVVGRRRPGKGNLRL